MNMTYSPSNEDEKKFLESVYQTYTVHDSSQTREMRGLIFKTFEPFINPNGVGLELGCSDGLLTEMLSKNLKSLDVVDGSKKFIDEAIKRPLKNVNFIYSLFEEFSSQKKYDFIFASYILEHVLNPIQILKIVADYLKPNGLAFIVVPNSRALSRQLAFHMGLIDDLKTLTQNDIGHGHRRVYDRASLNMDIEAANLEHISQGGIMLKILADFQMDELIDSNFLQKKHLDGLYKLGLEFPDFCGSLFSICRRKR